jgi:ubiquinone/menaquinone biosynthesis C-methylase UbiE
VYEITRTNPNSVLEIGPGNGLLKNTLAAYGIKVTTLDYVSDTNPDVIASAINIPFDDNTFDVCCAFQMLEHIEYTDSLKSFKEMARVSKKNIIISLPNCRTAYQIYAKLPKGYSINFYIEKPFQKRETHKFDGQHYWEINKKNYDLKKILTDLSEIALIKENYRAPLNPYHHFFIFGKKI